MVCKKLMFRADLFFGGFAKEKQASFWSMKKAKFFEPGFLLAEREGFEPSISF